MFALFLVLVVLVAITSAMTCPKSGSAMHAGCEVKTVFESSSCEQVQNEIMQRINGQSTGKWSDPHNNGTYTLLAHPAGIPATWEFSRLTGDKKYTDLINFDFTAYGTAGCQVEGCSESQVFSIGDYGTNFCNIHDLYCKDAGCNSFTKLSYTETTGKCTECTPSACTPNAAKK